MEICSCGFVARTNEMSEHKKTCDKITYCQRCEEYYRKENDHRCNEIKVKLLRKMYRRQYKNGTLEKRHYNTAG